MWEVHLLLPDTLTYVLTDWGFYGANSFYNSYFMPSAIVTQGNFGGGYASSAFLSDYYKLTTTMVVNNSITQSWLQLLQKYSVRYLLLDKSIVSGENSTDQVALTAFSLLAQSNRAELIYNGTYLELWKVVCC